MSRTLPPLPHPDSQFVNANDRLSREWADWISKQQKALEFNTPLTGIATLTATTSVVVSFTTPEPTANYDIYYALSDDRRAWTTSKGTASFQANSNISTTVVLGWMLVRR